MPTMNLKTLLRSACVLSILLLNACKDDTEITATIVGKWSGERADFKLNPTGIIPAFTLHENQFRVQLEFKNDGSLLLTDNKGVTENGSYVLADDQVTISINYKFELMELAGTYTINTLTTTNLAAEIEREGLRHRPFECHAPAAVALGCGHEVAELQRDAGLVLEP